MRQRGAPVGLDCGTGPVGGQLQHLGRVRELLTPVGELRFERLTLEPLALPGREVRVLQGQLGQRGGQALREGLVEGGHFAHQHAHGPAVGDDVVQVEHQHVLPFIELQQQRTQHGAVSQREGLADLGLDESAGFSLALVERQGTQVHALQGKGRGRRDHLEGVAGFSREGGAQHFVTAHEFREAARQGGRVQRAFQAQRRGHVVQRAVGDELIQEPQALLREGQRQRARPFDGPRGRQEEPVRGSGPGLDGPGERIEG
ncbi:hypothetical protein COSO111634_25170 [Corallococcus soli]